MLERFATVGIQWKLSCGEIRDEEFRDTVCNYQSPSQHEYMKDGTGK